mgnify:CR=1 FL=1
MFDNLDHNERMESVNLCGIFLDKYITQDVRINCYAQDIEKLFPELVSESNGIKSVNYQGLVPVFINALKEQEERIERLEKLLLDS